MVRRRKIKKMMIMTRMMMIIMAEKTQNNTNEEKRRKINITFKAKAIQDLTFYPFFMCKKCRTTKNLTKTQHNATTSPQKVSRKRCLSGPAGCHLPLLSISCCNKHSISSESAMSMARSPSLLTKERSAPRSIRNLQHTHTHQHR